MTTLIYGGTGGIGQAVAKRLSQQGQHVHLVGRNKDTLTSLANELSATYTCGDVNNPEL